MTCLQPTLDAEKRDIENNKKKGKKAFSFTFEIQLSTINKKDHFHKTASERSA